MRTAIMKAPLIPTSPEEPRSTETVYHPDAGKKAFAALLPALDNIAEADFVTAKVDVEAATFAVLGVVGLVTSPDVRARFARQPREDFDMDNLDGLEPACFATLYAL